MSIVQEKGFPDERDSKIKESACRMNRNLNDIGDNCMLQEDDVCLGEEEYCINDIEDDQDNENFVIGQEDIQIKSNKATATF